jgi:diguanylate cyclase (GGDEF)-like protein
VNDRNKPRFVVPVQGGRAVGGAAPSESGPSAPGTRSEAHLQQLRPLQPESHRPAGQRDAADERFRALFEHAALGVALSELDGTFIDVNPRLRELLSGTGVDLVTLGGVGLIDLVGHLPEGGDDARAWREALVDVRTGRRPVARAELPIAPPDAPPRWLRVTTALVVVGDRRCLLSHLEDTTAQRLAEQGLARLPLRDALTGLADRALLGDRVSAALAGAAAGRHGGQHSALLRLELHDFTHVNEVLGRDGGDAVLVAIARRLAGLVRADDTVARVVGVGFAVLAADLSDEEALAGLARRLERALTEPLDVAAARLRIAVSVGGDLIRAGDSVATVFLRAEQAVIAARRDGRRDAEIDVRETDLRGTDLRGTDLRGTDLLGTDPRGTDPRGTDPRGTDLRGTDARGTDRCPSDPDGRSGGDSEARGNELRETDQRPA